MRSRATLWRSGRRAGRRAPGRCARGRCAPGRCAPSQRTGGFTLIEVLVALMIVAITLGAGIKAAGALTNNSERLGEVSAAQWCADNQLTGLRLSGLTPPIGDSDFTCSELGRDYRGNLSVRPTPNADFVRVEAQMFDSGGGMILSLSTILRK